MAQVLVPIDYQATGGARRRVESCPHSHQRASGLVGGGQGPDLPYHFHPCRIAVDRRRKFPHERHGPFRDEDQDARLPIPLPDPGPQDAGDSHQSRRLRCERLLHRWTAHLDSIPLRRPYCPQTVAPKAWSTGPIGFAKELPLPPAKFRPTGLLPESVTMRDPESPERMKLLAT